MSLHPKKTDLSFMLVEGSEIMKYFLELAQLRIQVFRDYPYLYDGSIESEKSFIELYGKYSESMVLFALCHGKFVGATTAIPLKFALEEFQIPFIKHSLDLNSYLYLGESVLDKACRGLGCYKVFFDAREKHARDLGLPYACFCAVEREENHPRRPDDYTPLDNQWKKMGYEKLWNLETFLSWKEVGEEEESSNKMIFWVKQLDA